MKEPEWSREDLRIKDKLHDIGHGERVPYYRGHLALDRRETRYRDVGDVAWGLWLKGKVALCQRRHGPHDYEYIAVGVRRG